jgi:Phage integrase family
MVNLAIDTNARVSRKSSISLGRMVGVRAAFGVRGRRSGGGTIMTRRHFEASGVPSVLCVPMIQLAEIPEHKAFIHNFRHSFAIDLLTRGIPIEDVAALLGNSVRIVEKHYAHLVKSRRDAIELRVRTLWDNEGAA